MEIINVVLTGVLVGLIMLGILVLLIVIVGLICGILFELSGNDWISTTVFIMIVLAWIKIVYTWGPELYVLLL